MEGADELGTRLAEDNAFFKSLIDLIPSTVYFDQDTKDEIKHGGSGDVADQADSSEEKSSLKKHKKEKRKGKNKRKPFDERLENKTVTQLQEELDAKNNADEEKKPKEKKLKTQDGDTMKSSYGNLEELRERLHARIADLKGKRGQLNPEDWMEKKKLKRKQSKLKLKIKKKKEKLNNIKGDTSEKKLPNGGVSSPVKPVYNKEGKIVFSKFDFADSGEKQRKNALSDLTGKDYKKILDNLDKRKEKLKQVQQKDVLAGRELKKKTAWEMAIGKAEGVKIKDDPVLLTKALKKKEKRKEKTKKSWESRDQQVEDKQKERQDKRQKNIDLRKQTKFKNKMKKASKRGRVIPGF